MKTRGTRGGRRKERRDEEGKRNRERKITEEGTRYKIFVINLTQVTQVVLIDSRYEALFCVPILIKPLEKY